MTQICLGKQEGSKAVVWFEKIWWRTWKHPVLTRDKQAENATQGTVKSGAILPFTIKGMFLDYFLIFMLSQQDIPKNYINTSDLWKCNHTQT